MIDGYCDSELLSDEWVRIFWRRLTSSVATISYRSQVGSIHLRHFLVWKVGPGNQLKQLPQQPRQWLGSVDESYLKERMAASIRA